MSGENDTAPGWTAIDAALERLYGAAVPLHVAPQLPSYLGGPEPLDGISIYARDTPVPHWHLISYGMSDLYEPSSNGEPDEGIEFTLRALRRPDALQPPAWAVMLIQQLATYVRATGRWFEPGNTIRPAELTLGDRPTDLTALIFTVDSELGVIATLTGSLTFLQIAAVTDAEYAAAKDGNGLAVLEAIKARVPLHVIDPGRHTQL